MPTIERKPLELPGEDAPKLRYRPLPALGVADYYSRYVHYLGQTGVFDYLSTAGAGLNLADVRDLDLSAIGVVGTAFARLLGAGAYAPSSEAQPMTFGEIALDHASRFGVQAKDNEQDDWIDLDTAEAFNKYVSPGHMFDLVKVLGGEALHPLLSRLPSPEGGRRSASPKPSTATGVES